MVKVIRTQTTLSSRIVLVYFRLSGILCSRHCRSLHTHCPWYRGTAIEPHYSRIQPLHSFYYYYYYCYHHLHCDIVVFCRHIITGTTYISATQRSHLIRKPHTTVQGRERLFLHTLHTVMQNILVANCAASGSRSVVYVLYTVT